MGKWKPLTSSERRGVIIVAIVALLVTGLGAVVSYWGRPSIPENLEEVENLSQVDTVFEKTNKKSKRESSAAKKKKKKKTSTKKRKTYSRRSPIDEEV